MGPTTVSAPWRGLVLTALTVLTVLGLLLTACGKGEDGAVELKADPQLSERLQQVQRGGGSALLRDLTGGDWDLVHVFPQPVSRGFVERRVGSPVKMGKTFTTRGHILVFKRDGQVQRAVYTTPNNLVEGDYSNRVTVRARPTPGSPVLELVDPPA